MRIFVTGATGFVGSAVVRELLSAGHEVTGLARSDAGADALARAGAAIHRGHLDDLDGLQAGAGAADGVIHTAFNHDFSSFAANCAADGRVIEALGTALAGSLRPLLVTSGTGLLPPGTLATEETHVPPAGPGVSPRVASEHAAAIVTERGVNVGVVRLPPSVHGAGDHGFVPHLIEVARRTGVSAYVGTGENRWPAVHRLDAARLFRLAVEANEPGARYHAVAEEGLRFRDIAQAIARRLGVPATGLTPEDARGHFGWFAHFAAMGAPASSEKTLRRLGWQPTGPGLMTDLAGPDYFEG